MKYRFVGFLFWLLEKLDAIYKEPCRRFGGLVLNEDGKTFHSRTCEKLRWHTDSHAYKVNNDNPLALYFNSNIAKVEDD